MRSYQKYSVFGALLALLAGGVAAQPVSFGLFGDMPYSYIEREELPKLIAEMDHEDLAFVVHDGDIKNGSSECSDTVLRQVLGVFQASHHPLVYVPGDNEWTDCHRASNGGYDPVERLNTLRELFFVDDYALGQRKLKLLRQSHDPVFARYRENVRWEAGGALFVGLNVPGSENGYHGATRGAGPAPEFIERSAANRVWLAQAFDHARVKKLAGIMIVIQANPGLEAFSVGNTRAGYREFLIQLRTLTVAFGKPVVLVHGDTHWQQIDQPMLDAQGKELVSNFTRVETYGSPFMGWIKATVDASEPQVFTFSPRRWHASKG